MSSYKDLTDVIIGLVHRDEQGFECMCGLKLDELIKIELTNGKSIVGIINSVEYDEDHYKYYLRVRVGAKAKRVEGSIVGENRNFLYLPEVQGISFRESR